MAWASVRFVRQPLCDESGVGFGARRLAENSTALWSHQSILRSDETWLPEWSGNLGGVQRWRSSVASGVLGQASLFCLRRKASWLKVGRGAGCNLARRNEHTSRTEARLTRNGGGQV